MHRSAGDVPLTAPAAAAGRGSARGGGAAAAGAALAAGEEAFDDLARRKGGMALDKAVPRYLSEVPPPRPADILPRTVRLADFPRRDLPVGPRELHAAEEGLEATAIFAWGSLSARLLDVDGRSFSAARASTLAQERAGGDEPAGGCVGGTDSIWLALRRDASGAPVVRHLGAPEQIERQWIRSPYVAADPALTPGGPTYVRAWRLERMEALFASLVAGGPSANTP